jgi:hypothetical protein
MFVHRLVHGPGCPTERRKVQHWVERTDERAVLTGRDEASEVLFHEAHHVVVKIFRSLDRLDGGSSGKRMMVSFVGATKCRLAVIGKRREGR